MSEHPQCKNCHSDFTIEPEDFAFYEKVQVPPPTWCPLCRAQRRLAWRAERGLWKRTCTATGKEVFSMFDPESHITVVDNDYWWSDAWDPMNHGKTIDWNRPLLAQLYELSMVVPCPARSVFQIENSDYSNNAGYLKNCYLVFSAERVENSMHSTGLWRSRDCIDCNYAFSCELCYWCVMCTDCYRCVYSIDCENSHDLLFCKNVTNASNCIGCVNIKNKQYCIFNEQYTKEEYEQKRSLLRLDTTEGVEQLRTQFFSFLQQFPVKYIHESSNENSSGEYIFHTKDAQNGYFISTAENCKYCQFAMQPSIKDCYDYTFWGTQAELVYDSINVGTHVSRIKFSYDIYPSSSEIEYSLFCSSSTNLFLCFGLKKKQWCILNTQYTKEEYEQLVPRLREHMTAMPYVDMQGRSYPYGEFLPPEFLPFAYNDTLAYELFPMTKQEAERKGYRWRDPVQRNYQATRTPEQLPHAISSVGDEILQDTIACAHGGSCAHNCTSAFKILPQELAFYRAQQIPLPHECTNCRHHSRIIWRNPMQLQERRCQCAGRTAENGVYKNAVPHDHADTPCPRTFLTAYPSTRPESVYCKECYQAETI